MPETQTVEFISISTPAAVDLIVRGTNTVSASGSNITQRSNAPGRWTADFTDVPAGRYGVVPTDSGGEQTADWDVVLTLTTATFIAFEPVDVVRLGGDSSAPSNAATAFNGGSYNVGGGGVVAASVTGNVGGNVTGSVGSVTGGINTGAGTITTLDGLDTAQDTQHGTTQSAIAALNNLSAAQVNAEVDTALADYDPPTYTELLNLIRLLCRKDAALAIDLASLLTTLNADLGSGTGAFDNTNDSQEAIRDRGDVSWITATSVTVSDKTGFSLASNGLDLVTAWTVDITGDITGNLTGNVGGNVAGTVASVTGNVGGNVVGSVASVTGGINTGSGTITTLDALDTAQDTQHGTTQTAVSNLQTDATTLLGRLTASRAGYLDNLNVGGAVASQADIDAINESASRRVLLTTLGLYERPESGSTVYTIEARTFDADGAAADADSSPTLAVTGQTTGDLSANLGTISNPATGVYRWTYTVASGATLEPIRLDLSATISSSTFTLAKFTQVLDLVAVNWTSTDATRLQAIYDKLPSRDYLAGTTDSSGAPVATDIRSAVGLSAANLDTQLADIPTVSEFEARTLVAASYFDPAADQVIVVTNNDKTGYSISGTITTLDALDTAQDTQHATTQTAIGNLENISAAEVNAEVDTALADYDPPTHTEVLNLIRAISRKDSAFATDGSATLTAINQDLGSGAGTFANTTDALEGLRDHVGDGTNLTEAGGTGDHLSAIPWNAAWDAEVQSEATDALNAYDPPTRTEATADKDEVLARLGSPAGASVSADIAAVKAETNTIVTDTNELQTDLTDGGRLDLILDATLADTNELQGDWTDGGRLDLIVDSILSGLTALAAKFTGITAVKDWLALIMGKTLDATTLTEVQATTAGASYDNETDSLQARQDGTVVVDDFTSNALADLIQNVTPYAPALQSGGVFSSPIVSGDDYTTSTRRLRASVTGWEGGDLMAATAVYIELLREGHSERLKWIASSVTDSGGGAYIIYFSPTAAETKRNAGKWRGQIKALFASNSPQTVVNDVTLTVLANVS